MAAAALGAMALVVGVLVGVDVVQRRAEQAGPGYLRRADFGDAWPLTVDEGRVVCQPGRIVVFITSVGTYAVNGSAERGGMQSIDAIWLDDPKLPGAKIRIDPILNAGLALCD